MKKGATIPPGIAATVIVLVVVGIAFMVYRSAGVKGRVQLTPDQVQQMQKMMGQQKTDNGNNTGMMPRAQHSLPPGTLGGQ